MPHVDDEVFLSELVRQQREHPTFYPHLPSSYISNILNPETLTEGHAHYETAKKLLVDHLPLYSLKEHLGGSEEEARRYVETHFTTLVKQWCRSFEDTPIELKSTQFKKKEEIRVSLEQLNAIDAKHGITWRKSLLHRHEFFEIIYIHSGHCTTTISGIPAMLQEGDICIYNLQAVHQIGLFDKNAAVFNVLIKPSLLSSTFLNVIQNNDYFSSFFINSIFDIASTGQHLVFRRNKHNDCAQYLRKIICEYYQGSTGNQEMMKSLLIPFFTSLSLFYKNILAKESAHVHNDRPIDITQIILYISQHASTITIETLAEHYKYTPRSMMRIIKKYTHRRFKDIVRQFRLRSACNLLVNTDMPIADIAIEVGYTERSYLDLLLKDQYGLTASEYRIQYRPQ